VEPADLCFKEKISISLMWADKELPDGRVDSIAVVFNSSCSTTGH
jgi:hypothetical protein